MFGRGCVLAACASAESLALQRDARHNRSKNSRMGKKSLTLELKVEENRAGLLAGPIDELSISSLEVEPQCQLANAVPAVVAESCLRLAELGIAEVALRRVEVRMVEDVEEVREEGHFRAFCNLERLP